MYSDVLRVFPDEKKGPQKDEGEVETTHNVALDVSQNEIHL